MPSILSNSVTSVIHNSLRIWIIPIDECEVLKSELHVCSFSICILFHSRIITPPDENISEQVEVISFALAVNLAQSQPTV